MTSLFNYPLLVNDVFYRSEHVLSYIERHPDMSPLDWEAISNTILDALIEKGLIDPSKESLDISSMSIMPDLTHYIYNPSPNVTSIPLHIKEAMRHNCLQISGSVPISVFYAKPAGKVSFCIYDMNTALSFLFHDFTFINCSYDSPTREGVRAKNRPFLEIELNGEKYLVDALTKRIFKSSWFKEKYNMHIDISTSKKDFNKEQKETYAEQTKESNSYATYLTLYLAMAEVMKDCPDQEETNYEVEQSRKNFPDSFQKQQTYDSFNLLHIFKNKQ